MKKILIGISGGIAAYKTLDIISILIKKGYDVVVSVRAEKPGQEKIESQKLEKDLTEALQKARLLMD